MSTAQVDRVTTGAQHAYHQSLGVGRRSGKGFAHPVGVAMDSAGFVYVLNRSSTWKDECPRVTVTSFDEETLREIGTFGREPGCLFAPTALALDSADRLYVTDEHLHTITVFDTEGCLVSVWGEHGPAPGQLDRPSGIAVDSTGDLWVVDHGNARVQKFTADGRYLLSFGSPGTGPGQFDLPWGVATGAGDDVWVADWRNNRVQRFDSGGRYLASYGAGVLKRPAGVAVSPEGTMYVTDWGHDSVRVLDSGGALLETWRGEATLSRWAQEYLTMYDSSRGLYELAVRAGRTEEASRFRMPSGIALGPGGLVLVADAGRHRVQVYRRTSPEAPTDVTVHENTGTTTIAEPEETAPVMTTTARRDIDPLTGTFDLWDLPTDEAFLFDTLRHLFTTWWSALRFGVSLPGATWQLHAPNAPLDVRLREGTVTVDFGPWNVQLRIGPYPTDPLLANLRGLKQGERTARAELGRALDEDGAPTSWFVRLTAANGSQQLMVWLPSPFVDEENAPLDPPDWDRLAAWDDLRHRCLDLEPDPVDRTAQPQS